MNSLATKIELLKDEDAQEHFEKLKAYHDESATNEAIFILGRIRQNEHVGEAIYANLSAQTVIATERFLKEKKYEALGFKTGDDFLNNSAYSPMTKHQYYDRLAMVNKHGIDVADLLTSIGISMRSQKLLSKGDIEVRNDMVYVGGKEFDSTGSTEVKDLIVELVEDRRKATAEKEKLERTVEKQKEQIERGVAENEELRRNIDEIDETTRFERALMHAVNSLLLLAEAIGELDDFEKAARGSEDLKLFAQQYFKLSDAYGVKRSLTEAVPAGDSIVDKAIAEMAQNGDLEGLD